MLRPPSVLLVVALTLLAARAEALILIGDDESNNLVAPANGAPWDHVAFIGPGSGTGVYLGNGFLLTANHVGLGSIFLNGNTYSLDSSFGSGGAEQIGGADIKLLRIIGDPGLSALPIIGASDHDLNKASTLIGWGVGRGATVPNQGWQWGDASTEQERWGTNVTLSTADTTSLAPAEALLTSFSRNGGPEEAQLTLIDSGSGLFQQFGGVWKLAGTGVDVTTGGEALYDNNPNTAGDQPDFSYFVRLTDYRDQINSVIATANVPEPGPTSLSLFGLLVMTLQKRRARPARY